MNVENTRFAASLVIEVLRNRPQLRPCFDLDGVLLDAHHRIKLKPCGTLDLDHYRANTTAENVARDRDLPLLDVVRWLNANDRPYDVATARVFCEHTANRLEASAIRPVLVMARQGHDDRRGDAILKSDHFIAQYQPSERCNVVLIDDLQSNCEAAKALGMHSIRVLTDSGLLMR